MKQLNCRLLMMACHLALVASCSPGPSGTAVSGKHEDLLGRLSGVHTLVTSDPAASQTQLDVNFSRDSAKLVLPGQGPRVFGLAWLPSEAWPKAKLVQAGQAMTSSVCGYMTLSPVRDANQRERNVYLELQWVRAPGLENAVARTLTNTCNWMHQVQGPYQLQTLSPCLKAPGNLKAIWQRCQVFAASHPSNQGQGARRSAALHCLGAKGALGGASMTSREQGGSAQKPEPAAPSVRELWKAALVLAHPDRNPKDLQCAEAATKLVNDARTWLDSLTL
jgi:hypothetical protein